jgi:hypothetical protein
LKNTVGHSGIDVLELIIGIVLNILGGTLIGLAVGDPLLVLSGSITTERYGPYMMMTMRTSKK